MAMAGEQDQVRRRKDGLIAALDHGAPTRLRWPNAKPNKAQYRLGKEWPEGRRR